MPDNLSFLLVISSKIFSFSSELVASFPFLSASLQCYFCGIASDAKLRFASMLKANTLCPTIFLKFQLLLLFGKKSVFVNEDDVIAKRQ